MVKSILVLHLEILQMAKWYRGMPSFNPHSYPRIFQEEYSQGSLISTGGTNLAENETEVISHSPHNQSGVDGHRSYALYKVFLQIYFR